MVPFTPKPSGKTISVSFRVTLTFFSLNLSPFITFIEVLLECTSIGLVSGYTLTRSSSATFATVSEDFLSTSTFYLGRDISSETVLIKSTASINSVASFTSGEVYPIKPVSSAASYFRF